MANLRPTTNLIIPEDLMLPKRELKSRFLFVYNHGYVGAPSAFMTKMWASVFFPSIAHDPKFGTAMRGRVVAKQMAKTLPYGYLRIKKVDQGHDQYFIASVPLYSGRSDTVNMMTFLKNWFLGEAKTGPKTPTAETLQELRDTNDKLTVDNTESEDNKTIPGPRVVAAMKLNGNAAAQLKETLLAIRVQSKGALSIIFADFKITSGEAQQLTTTPWVQLRDIDIYPLLLQWVRTIYGELGVTPLTSFPISKIAMTLPPSHVEDARINEYNLSIGPKGTPFYLPKEVHKGQTVDYEDRYTQAGARTDGSFCMFDIDQGAKSMSSGHDLKNPLPANMPVLIDWVNLKYAYTNTSGDMTVLDLIRFRKADVSHIRTLIDDTLVTPELIDLMTRMGEAAGVPANKISGKPSDFEGLDFGPTIEVALQQAKKPQEWYKAALLAYKRLEDKSVVKLVDINSTGFGPFRALARYFKEVEAVVRDNIDPVYNKYSVSTVIEAMPWLVMIAKYNDDMPALRAADTTNRKAAIEQGVDPKWKPPSIPLLSSEIGFLPHQSKIRNLLKDSPDFAILPVQAGGGKSVLLLTDILYEIKANRSQPYLVLCPGHLVANYVKEVVYFTGGKLNVVAITRFAIRQNGWARLKAILVAAPRNTVVVTEYDSLAYREQSICYGTKPIEVFPVIDFLRQFAFGYVALDESHLVKNATSRSKSTMALITDIPKKRLASGTMVHDSPSDLAMQVAMMDPTLFGDKEKFNETYGEVVRGGRVIQWKKGAPELIQAKIRSRIVSAGAMRKEWAALLPTKREWIGGVELRTAQLELYNTILGDTVDKITEKAKAGNKNLQKFLGLDKKKKITNEDLEEENDNGEDSGEDEEEDAADEDAGESVESALRPYLARLEAFLMAPASDVLGKTALKGDDRISPKTMAIIERIRLHIFGGEIEDPDTGQKVPYGPFPGKVLVFTNSVVSAEEVWALAGPELQKCGVLYKAARKLEDGARFEKDKRVKWMVGVSASMETGLNFQFASRLIRTETVWNPGTLEQGNSRINRPELKAEELRKEIFFDTIVANHTIDITKTARLISKVIAAAKFENAENADYATIPDVEIIKMTLEDVREFNSWEAVDAEHPGLRDYAIAQSKYEQVRNADYEQYKQDYIELHGEGPVKQTIPVAPIPADAKLLKRVPYAPGLDIYNAKEMGLVRIDEYLNISSNDDDDSSENEDDSAEDSASPIAAQAASLKGRLAHTEFGDGYISNCSPITPFVRVSLLNGYSMTVRKAQCFLITRGETSTKDIRNQLLKSVGIKDIATPVDVPAERWVPMKQSVKDKIIKEKAEKVTKMKEVRETELKSALSIELTFVVANGFLGIDYIIDETNHKAMQALSACGFRPSQPFYYSKIINAKALELQFKLWQEKGLRPDPVILKQNVPAAFREMLQLLKSGQIRNHAATYKAASSAGIVNFYRLSHKASSDKMLFKPYPVIQDGVAYIALPSNGQAGTKNAMLWKRPSYRWHLSEPTLSYYGTIQQIIAMMKKVQSSGVQITNIDDLKRDFVKLKKMKIRAPSDDII
jgi:SNF2 family DNA or RNA helicase